MNNKKKYLFLGTVGLFALALVVSMVTGQKYLGKNAFADEPSYVLNTGTCTDAEVTAKEFVRNTADGNPITFKMTGDHSFDQYSVSKINVSGSAKESASLYNETPISGLTQMTFRADNFMNYKCFYGSDLENLEYAHELINDRVGETITIDFEGVNIQYFKLVCLNLSGNYNASFLKPISLKYKCANAINRGVSFANGTSISLDDAFPNDGTFAFDYKATAGETLRICFLQNDWSKYFGYMSLSTDGTQIYGTTEREHHFGIKVSPLSDGYIHVTIDFTQFGMTNNKDNDRSNIPESIKIIYIYGCDAEGYIDLLPTTHALEAILDNYTVTSTGSIQSIYFPFDIAIKPNMEVIVDMVYDDPTQKLSFAFGAEGSTGSYHPYDNVKGSDNRLGYTGGYIEHVSSSHIRIIYDLDALGLEFNVLHVAFLSSGSLATGTLNFYINL